MRSHIPIGKWIDHFYYRDENSKIKVNRVKKSSQMILAVNCDPLIAASSYHWRNFPTQSRKLSGWIFSRNKVVKSISDWYIIILYIFLLGFAASAIGQVAAGPMLGYSEMREVVIWVQTQKESQIQYKYWPTDSPADVHWTEKEETDKDHYFMNKIVLDEVLPGKKYAYELYVDKKKMSFPYPLTFQTQELWQWRKDPPAFKFAVGSCTYTNQTEFDRPGRAYGGTYDIFNKIYDQKPDFMVWGGDNIYLREVDWNTRSGVYKRYNEFKKQKELQPLFASTHNYAVWDDHDYGPNDADRAYWGKEWTRDAFKENWGNPNYIFPDEAITGTFFWQDVQFFVMDDRSFKAPNGDPDPGKDYFGKKQLDWLIDALTLSNATFKVVVTGGQIVNPAALFENMSTYPVERDQLFDRIAQNKISGVIFITGDRHNTSLRKLDRPGNYPIYDLTVSPLTSGVAAARDIEKNSPDLITGTLIEDIQTFGLIEVSGPVKERKMKINIFDNTGLKKWDFEINSAELQDSGK